MKKSAKTFQSNIDLVPNECFGDSSTREIYRVYTNRKTGEIVRMTKEWARQKGDELVAYAELPSTSRIAPFYFKLGMTHKVWEGTVKTYQYLNNSLEEAKDIIGTRREKGGMGWDKGFELNPQMVSMSLCHYLIEHKEMVEEKRAYEKELTKLKADLSKDAIKQGLASFIIEKQTAPLTQIVTDQMNKKKKKELNDNNE